jgi:hypothetical protein
LQQLPVRAVAQTGIVTAKSVTPVSGACSASFGTVVRRVERMRVIVVMLARWWALLRRKTDGKNVMSETNSPTVATVDPASAAALPSLATLGVAVAPDPMAAIDAGSVAVAATPAVDPSPAVADPAPVAAVAELAAEPAP